MKTTTKRNRLSFLLILVLIAALALVMTGCSETEQEPASTTETSAGLSEGEETAAVVVSAEDGAELGAGETEFQFTVTDLDGNETCVTVHTDKTTLGEALQELGLIEGEEGPYGLYVKTVNGITLDYDKDKAYWGFYINGRYAMSGVDVTEIDSGDAYELRAERG